MTPGGGAYRRRSFLDRFASPVIGWAPLTLILAAWLLSACTRFHPPQGQRDLPAERMVAGLLQANAGLTGFRCVAKITLSGPNRPTQSFRAAMAGQLTDRLRIDMFAPYGGSAGTFSSDGKHLFLVTLPSREYYKRRIGSGSLQRLLKVDVTVGDLLELLVGRIPMNAALSARLMPDEEAARTHLVLVDRWGRTRQQIILDASLHPERSIWFDVDHNPVQSLMVAGQQTIDGFVLPTRIDLSAESGQRVSVALDRYEANARFEESLFTLAPPSS
jgi:outer membrane lipoprotein-sorting protein